MPTATGVRTFTSNDVDEATEICGTYFFRNRIQPQRSPRPFGMQFTAGVIGTVTAGLLRFTCGVKAEVGDMDTGYSVAIPMQGELQVHVGRSEITGSPGVATIVGPVSEAGYHGWARASEHAFILKFDRHAAEADLARMLGRDSTGPIEFDPQLGIRSGIGAEWVQLLRPVLHALNEQDGLIWNPLMNAHLSSTLMVGLLLASDHNYRDALESRSSPAHPPVVRRAMTYIEEHAHEPITMPLIAAAVGCSLRTLQRGFDDHLDTTPNAYLARVRMDGAHRDLVAGTTATASVTEIAYRWGFGNAGRFATNYRAIYGNPPSVTLRER